MGWIVFLVILISVVSSIRKKMKEAASENRQPTNQRVNRTPPPLSKEEQVRRVRAEIQRTIQQRQERDRQARTRSEVPRVPPVLTQNDYGRHETRSAPVPPALPPPLSPALDETLERQRELAQRLRDLEE